MKRIYTLFLLIILVLNFIIITPVFAENDVYRSAFSLTQGENGWYFCEFRGDEVYNLSHKVKDTWEGWGSNFSDYPDWNKLNGAATPASSGEVGLKFVSPKRGMVKIGGKAYMPSSNSSKGNGVIISICKGSSVLYKKTLTYDISLEPDISIPLRKGEELYFKISANENNAFDWTVWWPYVEFTDDEYVGDKNEGYYYSKNGNTETRLSYDTEKGGYISPDQTAFMNYSDITVSAKTSLIRRWVADTEGRFRIWGNITPTGNNLKLVFRKNGEKIKVQTIVADEKNDFDIRMYALPDDVMEVYVETDGAESVSAKWKIDYTEFLGTLPFCNAVSSVGYKVNSYKEVKLSDLILQGTDANFYSVKYDVPHNMIYNSELERWESSIDGDVGYISAKEVHPGNNVDTYMEFPLNESGKIWISGKMGINRIGDGVVSKIFINDELIWSSRIGGERAVRWNEPYDVSYFSDKVSVFANVSEGDIIKLKFDQWRKCKNDEVDISDIKISYVNGNPLSETTIKKRDSSVIIDLKNGKLYKDGSLENIETAETNDKVFISEDGAKRIFGDIVSFSDCEICQNGGTDYYSLSDLCSESGYEELEIDNKISVIWKGLSTEYTYSEISEMSVSYDEGGLFVPETEYGGDIRWDFTETAEGFSANGEAKIAGNVDGALKVIATGADPNISISGLDFSPEEYRYARIRLKDTTKNKSMNIFLSKNGGNYYQVDMETDSVPDTDFVDYVFDLQSGRTIKGTPQESYDTFRFDFMNNMYNDSDGAVQYIDSIVLSKNKTECTDRLIDAVSVSGTKLVGFSSEKEVSESSLPPYISLDSITPENITVTPANDYVGCTFSVTLQSFETVKYIDIFADDTYGNYKNYRIICRKTDDAGTKISSASYDADNKQIKISYRIYNPKGVKTDYIVIATVKNEEGILKAAALKSVSVSGTKVTNITVPNYSYETGDYIELFLWKDDGTYAPAGLKSEYEI